MLWELILYISGGTYSLKSTPNDRFFEKVFMIILFTLRVFARNLLRGNCRKNTFCILFWCLTWSSNPGFSCNKPTHYLPRRHLLLNIQKTRNSISNNYLYSKRLPYHSNNWWCLIEVLFCHLHVNYSLWGSIEFICVVPACCKLIPYSDRHFY